MNAPNTCPFYEIHVLQKPHPQLHLFTDTSVLCHSIPPAKPRKSWPKLRRALFFFDYWITLQPAAPNTCWFGVLHPVIWVTTYAIFLGFVASQRSPKLSGKPLPGRCQGSVTQRPKLAAPTKPTVPRIAFMAAGYKVVVRKP